MSQVEAFNDNVTEIAATQPSMAVTRARNRASDPTATERKAKEIKPPTSGINPADSRWPRWPNAWPDGSRQSRSR
jgi:hypothetical protein